MNKEWENQEDITAEEYNEITSIYFENTNIEPGILKTYTLMEDYTYRWTKNRYIWNSGRRI